MSDRDRPLRHHRPVRRLSARRASVVVAPVLAAVAFLGPVVVAPAQAVGASPVALVAPAATPGPASTPTPAGTPTPANQPEDGPNLLLRGGPVLLLACIAGGVWLAMRRRH